jgi:hypothetical protein
MQEPVPHSKEVHIQPHPHTESGHGKPPPRYQPIEQEDEWTRMFAPFGASPEDVRKFKEGVIKDANIQFKHQLERQVKAIKKMREEDST